MSAIEELRNDKNALISIVAEHYILCRQEIKDIQFKKFNNHKCPNVIQHGQWVFCYHRDMGVVYIK